MRRTSAILLPNNAEGEFGMVQRHSRWKSITMAQVYDEESNILGQNSRTEGNLMWILRQKNVMNVETTLK